MPGAALQCGVSEVQGVPGEVGWGGRQAGLKGSSCETCKGCEALIN